MNRIAHEVIGGFLSDIATIKPSPGAGAASGVALAMASALARKAVLMTLKHRREAELSQADGRLATIGEAALALADEDAARFAAMLAAKHEGPAAADCVDDEAQALDDLAKRMLALCDEVDLIVQGVRPIINANMTNDLTAALSLSESAAAIQRANASELASPNSSGV
ncbi:cyclodeaminase/cyclohydrolase family protein [Sphingobium sp. SCG-1]|uniref:cyclodeaminase/cyclohydrolase family protein n=1 Tax=Sphingobium sp. SCG-1 TaxID=2072936 RepID=UPI00166FB5DF|nr:cyclodeaminase/cyclohydrolase family protein [Sphingobium sp. SCG-1]